MNYGVVSQEQLEKIDEILTEKLIKIGVDCVIIIDMAGNIITAKDNGTSKYDVYSFAALAAGNFATVDAMAKLVGEQEFSLLFHKGRNATSIFRKSMMNCFSSPCSEKAYRWVFSGSMWLKPLSASKKSGPANN